MKNEKSLREGHERYKASSRAHEILLVANGVIGSGGLVWTGDRTGALRVGVVTLAALVLAEGTIFLDKRRTNRKIEELK